MGCCVSSGSVHEMGEGDWVEEDSQSEANVALKAEARNMFAMVDDDSSGFLDRAELATLIKMLVPPEEQEKLLSESELDAAMHEMDDDASGAIEFAEFFTWWKRRAALEAEAANCWSLEDVADPSAGLNEEVAVALTNGRERHSTLASTRHAGGASPRSASDTANPNEAAIAMAELGIDGDTLTGQPGAPKRKGNVRRKSVVALANKELANEAAMWTVSSAVAGGKSDEARVAQVALKREEKNMSRRSTRQRLQEAGCGCFMKSDRKKAAAARKKAAAVKKKKDLHDPRVQCRKMFDQIDDDGSGSLDVDEIPQLAALLGMKLTEEQKHAALAEMDADGSGSVDFEEFCSWWLVTGGNDDESTREYARTQNILALSGLTLTSVLWSFATRFSF